MSRVVMNFRLLTVICLLLMGISFIPKAYAAAPTSGLVGYWNLNEGSGTVAGDSAGSNPGTFVNSPTWTAGKINQGLNFDGSGQYVQLSTAPSVVSPYTTSFWFYPRALAGAQGLIAHGLGSATNLIMLRSSNDIEIDSSSAGSFRTWCNRTLTVSDLNQWHHLTVIINSTTNASQWKCYFNGIDVGVRDSDSSGTYANPGSANWTIGSYYNNSYWFNGNMDEVRIYNRALSAQDVSDVYNDGSSALGGSPPPAPTPTPPPPAPTPVPPTPSPAPPSGSGINCDLATLQAAVNSASRGATITCNAGSWDWGSTPLNITKGITLNGAGIGNTIVSGTALVSIVPDATAINNDEVIKITGFTFDGKNAASYFINVNVVSTTKPFKNLLIGYNKFQNGGSAETIYAGGQLRGVIYKNIFDRVHFLLRAFGKDVTSEWSSGNFPLSYGTADNLYFEDNTILYSSAYSPGDPGWSSIGQGGRAVFRFNTWDMTNAANPSEYLDIHGFQNWNGTPNSGQTGTMVVEYYDNSISNGKGYRWIAHRGSWGMFFDNTFTGTTNPSNGALQYSGGCGNGDISPNPAGGYIPVINNTYVFNNTVNGTRQDMAIQMNGCAIAENSNFWNQQTTFSGAIGVGRGTLAVRPATCTAGVGYWATDQGEWNSSHAGADGQFYKCTSTNTWTLYYTPYPYPHPLASGVSYTPPPPPTPSPTPPTPTPTPVTPTPTPVTPTPAPLPAGQAGSPSGNNDNKNNNNYDLRLINSSGTYYLIIDGVRHGITNPGLLTSYGFTFEMGKTATAGDLALPEGDLLLPSDGILAKTADDKTVWLVSASQRRGFTSATVFTSLGFNFNQVLVITAPELNKLAQGSNLDNPNSVHPEGVDVNLNGAIYWVHNNTLYPYPDLNTFNSWRVPNDFTRVLPANNADRALPVGGALVPRALR